MKKIVMIICTVFLNAGIFSCTPETLVGTSTPVACCDEEGNIPPPPPPPPPGDDGVDG
ncbi:hypothetical protein ACFQO1_03450 [Jejudonia soesokkakensis]|uniref:Uncharacterized protein n=1 Tax=Jejudonia soesokkakensis TaxID=1323432 RepID=A0ABW2MT48_9FLAO